MDRGTFLKELAVETESKILLVVLDGLGGLPGEAGKTELEAAWTPNMDELAARSVLGLTHPISYGITPGSGPSHLALFGYDPLKYEIGRGVLENLGLDVELRKGDVAVRGNFCTVEERDGRLVVVDRRAGRIPTEKNRELCSRLQEAMSEIQGVEVLFTPGMEHRFALRLRGEGLAGCLEDTDPQHEGFEPLLLRATCPQGDKTVAVVEELLGRVRDVLKGEERANFVLLRGFSEVPHIPSMYELFKLRAAAIATYPMYRGLARLVGMDLLPVDGMRLEHELETLRRYWKDYTFFYFHVKKTDSYGEDGNFWAKVKVIEEFDRLLPKIMALEPQVLVITGDHSTPSKLKGHSWHPNPFLLYSPYVRWESGQVFSEKACARGALGQFPAMEALPLMLAHALKLKKFGA